MARQLSNTDLASAVRATLCSLLGPAGMIVAPTLAVGSHFLGEYFGEDSHFAQSIGVVLAHIFAHLSGDAAHHLLSTLDASANQDIERATAEAIRQALVLARANRPSGIEHADLDLWFAAWDDTLAKASKSPEGIAALFQPSEQPDFILIETLSEQQWWESFRPTLQRWSGQIDANLPNDLDEYLSQNLLKLSRRALDHILREEEHKHGWVAWQEQFLKAILRQGIANLELVTAQQTELASIKEALRRLEETLRYQHQHVRATGSAPPPPGLFIGREQVLADLRQRLLPSAERSSGRIQLLTAVRGWPGVGKTTVAAAIAHDPALSHAFPDGLLWASLGQQPDIIGQLDVWARELGAAVLDRENSTNAARQVTALLREKRMLLIVDDVWKAEDAQSFVIGGMRCSTIITTRLTDVAEALAPTAPDVYFLNVLNDEQSFELLQSLAPEVASEFQAQCRLLAADLEGLPLALQVVGRLLNSEWRKGFRVDQLFVDLRTAMLMSKQVPTTMDGSPSLTVNAVLKKSTDVLDDELRDYFAYLGFFAPKPASFDIEAMNKVWGVTDPQTIASRLIDRGLIEPAGSGRYQMHALLVLHAKALLHEPA